MLIQRQQTAECPGPGESQAEVAWKPLDRENAPRLPGQPGLARGLLPLSSGAETLVKNSHGMWQVVVFANDKFLTKFQFFGMENQRLPVTKCTNSSCLILGCGQVLYFKSKFGYKYNTAGIFLAR